jgi:hypothetical protein
MQDDVFEPDALKGLLTTSLTVDAKRGKTEYTLMELFDVAKQAKRGNAIRFVHEVHPRERETRWDIRFTTGWVEKMKRINVAFSQACDMCEHIKKMSPRCSKANVEWHAMLVHPGSPNQPVHIDDEKSTHKGKRCYFTFIIPLTSTPKSGGTYFPKLGKIFSSFGGAVVFDGAVEHAGLENKSTEDRIFLYAAIFTGKDEN